MDQLPLADNPAARPLADRLRPQSLAQVAGQGHLTGPQGLLSKLIQAGTPQSVVFWGPPGVGKTTLARLYANAFGADFIQLSAVLAGVADVRKAVDEARMAQGQGRRTVLFVDEIHRFTKSQQDAFLPHVESGLLILVGATTENPSFALTNALLSRAQVLVLNALDESALANVLAQAEQATRPLPLTPQARAHLLHLAHGDARYLLNLTEIILATTAKGKRPLTPQDLNTLLPAKAALYDKDGDQHYDLISALHKAVRGSDPDAALYYLARMLEGGEDGLYLARRLIRMATEDIGLADPQALPQALAARDAYHMLGSPEGDLMLAQAAIYLALAPKSNATYTAAKAARALARETTELPPPKHIVNAPTKMMKQLGHGAGYAYDHDAEEAFSGQNYFPEAVVEKTPGGRPRFYHPVERGFERDMQKRLAYFAALRQKRQAGGA